MHTNSALDVGVKAHNLARRSSPEANALRTMLVPLVDAHNLGYKSKMWPEVIDVPDDNPKFSKVEVRLTIPGSKPLFLVEVLHCSLISIYSETTLRSKLQQWIDEIRANGSRAQQRRTDGSMPPRAHRSERAGEPV
jgi:hypothetical protein